MRNLKPLVVVGDSLLDVDLDGTATRLCPDAPVPVVDVGHRSIRPGGAALAALLATRSVEDVVLVSALGTDEPADALIGLVAGRLRVERLSLEGDTSCKTRVRAHGLPMLRLDSGAGRADRSTVSASVAEAIGAAGAVLVSDYGRGVSANPGIRALLQDRVGSVPMVWDPHPKGPAPIAGCTLVTPNANEAQVACEADDPAGQARQLCRRWSSEAVAVTLGERGAVVTEASPPRITSVPVTGVPAVTGDVAGDTCGAGDQFAVVATVALLMGEDVRTAVRHAVRRASEFVRAGGASAWSTGTPPTAPGPRPAVEDVFVLADRIRRAGGRLVATGGCFDLLHRGHVQLLSQARRLGDALVVCLNSDASVRRAKGASRPIVGQDDRARVVAALSCVDAVHIFDEDTPTELLARLQPDVWVKGTDYHDRAIPERATVERFGGRVVLLPVVPGYSTTRLVGARQSVAWPPPAEEAS